VCRGSGRRVMPDIAIAVMLLATLREIVEADRLELSVSRGATVMVWDRLPEPIASSCPRCCGSP